MDNDVSQDAGNERTHNQPYFTVGELSGAIKRTIEGQFEHVRVRGEISRPSIPASGHCYFTLKDAQSNLSAVAWKGVLNSLSVRPEDGLDVICTGKLTTFAGQSRYQLVVQSLEVAGEGALLKQLEERKRRLTAEGLFDPARKKPIPTMPRKIGIITSPTGAVIRDMLHRLRERFGVHVQLWGVPVQGEAAIPKITAAIDGFNALAPDGPLGRPDLLIVARGGGSLEDLWCFHDEAVVRAVARSEIPVISAVGHETDTTLIDFAADLRAPTPTAAAELATPVASELSHRVAEFGLRLDRAVTRKRDGLADYLSALSRGLLHPAEQLNRRAQQLDVALVSLQAGIERHFSTAQLALARLTERLPAPTQHMAGVTDRLTRLDAAMHAQMDSIYARARDQLNTQSRLLKANSYERVLERGFVLVADASGQPIKRASEAPEEGLISLRFADDTRQARLEKPGAPGDTITQNPPRKAQKTAPQKKAENTANKNNQGQLF
ncbi:MAG: exodeoxyribonuclease VII large subunit [Candidatus Puniceispirillaceae bacterium]